MGLSSVWLQFSTECYTTSMLDIPKKIVLDENQQPDAVQVPIAVFERIETIYRQFIANV